uniref:Reactive oxygen species modulator 1 n=1 Tax=Neogobius melanostomus TaxID=47308 RepID=A0A8C6TC89_9GOBI
MPMEMTQHDDRGECCLEADLCGDAMPVAVGPYGQTQPSCFDRVKMGFMMGFAVGMAAGAMFGTFSCLRIGMRGRELMGGVGKTMMQSGGTFGTFMAIGMGIRC